MKEWNNQFNPFNSMKVLAWKKHLEGCAQDNYLPPVTVDIDPSNKCNFDCPWCNAYDMMNSCKEMKMLPENHMIKLADFIKDWRDKDGNGPRSACIAGGGEPFTNPGIMGLLERFKKNKLEAGVITNGTLIKDNHINIIANTCRWIGFSMDCHTPETYSKVKGIKNGDLIYKVIDNIKKLTKATENKKCDVAFKYLIHPYNVHEIYESAKLAKEIGCRDFHMRPVGWTNLTKTNGIEMDLTKYKDTIEKQTTEALKLEDNNFHVYGVRHKFNQDFSPKKPFTRCWAIPILPTFGADGWVHTCFDMRGRDDLKMCKHYPNPEELAKFWNSSEHKNIIRSIKIEDCPRCTFTAYNQAVEEVIIKDRMCINFP